MMEERVTYETAFVHLAAGNYTKQDILDILAHFDVMAKALQRSMERTNPHDPGIQSQSKNT